MRFLRPLLEMHPTTTRDFTNLMAMHMRRELLDLARRFRRCSDADADGQRQEKEELLAEVPSLEDGDVEDLELWSAFQEPVEQLPKEEREVVGLIFYHGWTQVQIAEPLDVDERTVRRRWRSACQRLTETLGGRLPEV